ncbi:MAG: hypothetical protein GYB32_08345 [Algicola sp.]|nr:hypothetical protein [Algicola sp.]
MQRRDIIHIGYFKTGTTWFQQVFFPKVTNTVFSNQANASLDDNLIITRPYDFSAEKTSRDVHELFSEQHKDTLVLSRERLSGHPFTGGYDAKVIADRLKETFPSATIVIFIREQRQAIVSTYKEYVKRGGTAPFEKWIFTHERTIPSFQLDYFNYHKQINYYIKLFGKSHVKVYAYEDFKDNAKQFLKQFAEDLALEVDLSAFDFNKKVNKGFSTKSLNLIRWSNQFSKNKNLNPYPAIKIPFLRFLIEKLCKTLDGMFYNQRNTSFLKPKTLARINHLFGPSNHELNQLLDLDLESKGYNCNNNN